MAIRNRNIVICILLSMVTCGAYALYWNFMMAKEAVSVKDASDHAILEAILALVLPGVGLFLAERKFAAGCKARNIAHKDRSILYLILGFFFFGYITSALMQNELNKLTA